MSDKRSSRYAIGLAAMMTLIQFGITYLQIILVEVGFVLFPLLGPFAIPLVALAFAWIFLIAVTVSVNAVERHEQKKRGF